MEPNDFLRRLEALVPAPYTNLVRSHGVFAGRSRWRKRLPAPPRQTPGVMEEPRAEIDPHLSQLSLFEDNRAEAASAPGAPAAPAASSTLPAPPTDASNRSRRRSIPRAQLLMRVFHLDALACPRCATPMIVLAFLSEPDVVRKILLHLGLPADLPPTAPARHHDELLFGDDFFQANAPARSPP